jgi:UDP-N-acetylmuramoyl-L-alanine---L-glutamate ligase
MMRIQDLNGKKVCVIGYAREGQALVNALKKYAPQAEVTVADMNESIHVPAGVRVQLGPDYLQGLNTFDVVTRSGGIKDSPELTAVADKVTTSTNIFFDTIKDSGVRTIGITGSKGKSTTTTLIYEALKAYDPHTFLMGNIGIPMIEFLPDARPGNTFVIELSSYMLERLRISPNIAVVTSFFPEHLDYHGTVEAYWNAKRHIALYQSKNDAIFYNATYPQCAELANASRGERIPFTGEDFPANVHDTKFKGQHNQSNLAAAYKVATYLGVPGNIALEALKNADPLPHRLQNLGEHAGLMWVNDSFATAPEATIAALDALKTDIETLIVGGYDRGIGQDGLARYLAASKLKNIVFFPDTGLVIRKQMGASSGKNFHDTSDMGDAVHWAAEHTTKGKTVLLSPASPSFNLFKDFVVRGEAFVSAVESLDNA